MFGTILGCVIIICCYFCLYALFVAPFCVIIGWLLDKILTKIYGKDNDKGEEIWSNIFIFILAITIIATIGLSAYKGIPEIMIEKAEREEPYNYVTHEIINLSDNSEINGTISGGRRYVRGYIGETTTYHYYYKQYDGGMKLQKANEKNTTIYFTDGEPRAEWYSQTRTFWWKSETKYFCRIYIPEGSMTTEFEIDMN